MALERRQVAYTQRNSPFLAAEKLTDMASVVGRATPVPITGSGNVALHGLIKDLTFRGNGFTAGQST